MTASEIFKSIAWEPLVLAVLEQLFSKFALLRFGPIQWVITSLVTTFTDRLFDGISKFINVEVIAFRNDNFRIAFERKSVELKIMARSFGVESEQFEEARNIFRQDLKNIAHIELSRVV